MAARVLIIEDNPANLELMRYLLDAHGYTTLVAENGSEGLDVAQRERPDLVICDVQMPVMDGLEVVRRCKDSERLRQIPVVAVTAFAMVGDRDKMLAAGFDGYLAKPIAPETFVQQIESFLPPAMRAPVPAPPAETPVALPHRRSAVSILVVDDMPVNIELWRSLLEHSGFSVVTASGLNEGLRQARRVVPDLILSDVRMGDGSGYDLVRHVRSDPRLGAIPCVLVTSTAADEPSRAKGIALGATRYLFRPIEPQVLLHEIDTCLMEHQKSASRLAADSAGAAAPMPLDAIPGARGNVLLMDDRQENLNLLQLLLERAGFRVMTASHLAQALALTDSTVPDLILSDLNMPRDDGFALLTAVRAEPRLESVAFAFTSASDWTPQMRDKALRLGADRFFVRGSDPEQFVADVESCLSAREGN